MVDEKKECYILHRDKQHLAKLNKNEKEKRVNTKGE